MRTINKSWNRSRSAPIQLLFPRLGTLFGVYKPCGIPHFPNHFVEKVEEAALSPHALTSVPYAVSFLSKDLEQEGSLLSRAAAVDHLSLGENDSKNSSLSASPPFLVLPFTSPLVSAGSKGSRGSVAMLHAFTRVEKGLALFSSSSEEAIVVRNAAKMGMVKLRFRVICFLPNTVAAGIQRWWRRNESTLDNWDASSQRELIVSDAPSLLSSSLRATASINPHFRVLAPSKSNSLLQRSKVNGDVNSDVPFTVVTEAIPLLFERSVSEEKKDEMPLQASNGAYSPHPFLQGHLVDLQRHTLLKEGSLACTLMNAGSVDEIRKNGWDDTEERRFVSLFHPPSSIVRGSSSLSEKEKGRLDHPWIPLHERVAVVSGPPYRRKRSVTSSSSSSGVPPLHQAVSFSFRLVSLSKPDLSRAFSPMVALYEVEGDGTLTSVAIRTVFHAEGFTVVNDFQHDETLAKAVHDVRNEISRMSPAVRESIYAEVMQQQQRLRQLSAVDTLDRTETLEKKTEQEKNGMEIEESRVGDRPKQLRGMPMHLQYWCERVATPEELVCFPFMQASVDYMDEIRVEELQKETNRRDKGLADELSHNESKTGTRTSGSPVPGSIVSHLTSSLARQLVWEVLLRNLQSEKTFPVGSFCDERKERYLSRISMVYRVLGLAIGSGVECTGVELPDLHDQDTMKSLQYHWQNIQRLPATKGISLCPHGRFADKQMKYQLISVRGKAHEEDHPSTFLAWCRYAQCFGALSVAKAPLSALLSSWLKSVAEVEKKKSMETERSAGWRAQLEKFIASTESNEESAFRHGVLPLDESVPPFWSCVFFPRLEEWTVEPMPRAPAASLSLASSSTLSLPELPTSAKGIVSSVMYTSVEEARRDLFTPMTLSAHSSRTVTNVPNLAPSSRLPETKRESLRQANTINKRRLQKPFMQRRSIRCGYCFERGHHITQCPKLEGGEAPSSSREGVHHVFSSRRSRGGSRVILADTFMEQMTKR